MKPNYRYYLVECWRRAPSAQALSNWLIAAFTLCLAFLTYVTEEPYVVARAQPLQNFTRGGKPKESIIFDNIGRTPAYSFASGMAIATFPYPLGAIQKSLTEVPPNSVPLDLYASQPVGRPAEFQQALTDSDYDAVLDGKDRLIYVWGTIEYRDFAHLRHRGNFCFAFGGGSKSEGAGVCSVQRPRQYHIAEEEQQPHARPNIEPVPFP